MGRPRQELHDLLLTMADQVYFQPPANVQMVFPCIVYGRYGEDAKFADDGPYLRTKRYQVTIIDRNPDSEIRDKVADLPRCIFNRFFVTEGLNHDVFYLYF